MTKRSEHTAQNPAAGQRPAAKPGFDEARRPAAAPESVHLPSPRGPVSTALVEVLTGQVPAWMVESLVTEAIHAAREGADILFDEDLQLALFILYGLHHRGFSDVDDSWEWDPRLLKTRMEMEAAFEARLQHGIGPVPDAAPTAGAVVAGLFRLAGKTDGPTVPDHLLHRASLDQVKEFLVHHRTQQATGAAPQTWALGRLDQDARSFLMELGVAEHGNGRLHQGTELLADTLEEAALAPDFTAYIEHLPAITLASMNLISFFGLHRRLHGALLGRLAVYELASSLPSAKYSRGLRRLGFGDRACAYFDHHVETDAAHEQATGTALAGALAHNGPETREQVLFGAAAACLLDDLLATWQLQAWHGQQSSLRRPLEPNENSSRG